MILVRRAYRALVAAALLFAVGCQSGPHRSAARPAFGPRLSAADASLAQATAPLTRAAGVALQVAETTTQIALMP